MPNLELDFPLQDGRKPLPGFRLRRLEVLNWGTFHGKVAMLVADGRWTLVVGENGSGKSTVVDALRTLLVPPRLLNYNDASGEQKRRDRTRLSYIRGTWATVSQDESALALPQNLRGPGSFSILLAVFANDHSGEVVTLAQILWESNEKPSELYAIARSDKSISEHLANLGQSREFKKALRLRGFEPYDSFSAYSEVFRARLGIPNEVALEVFNQAIGVKEVVDINHFIRRHMLDGSDALDFIQNHLRPHFNELDACWRAIERAEKQLAALAPIADCHRKIEEAVAKKREFDRLLEQAPLYYALRHLKLRDIEARDLEEKHVALTGHKDDLLERRSREEKERNAIFKELSANSTQQSIERLQTLMDAEHSKLLDRQRRANEFGNFLKRLALPLQVDTAEQFRVLRDNAKNEQGRIDGNRSAADAKRVRCLIEKEEATRRRSETASELESLRTHRVLIPREFVAIRDDLTKCTGIAVEDIPFAGELMEVKSEYREWTGAIERLLHQFGVSLLVSERNYESVARYINERHLGTRFTFHRVPLKPIFQRQEHLQDPDRVSARLNFKDARQHMEWVKAEVSNRFNHICCADIQRLKSVDFGITREGLIRNGASRHTKDDRRQVNDAANYVLGWSVEEKIAALQRTYGEIQKKIDASDVKATEAEKQVKKYDDQLEALRGIMAVESFMDVDVRSVHSELTRLKSELTALESSSEQLQVLRKQLDAIEKRLKKLDLDASDLAERIGAVKRDQQSCESVRCELISRLDKADQEEIGRQSPSFAEVQERGDLTLANVRQVEEQVRDRLSRQSARQQGIASAAKEEMLPLMGDFLRDYPEHSADLRAGPEFAPDFAALRQRVADEELPEYKHRFEDFLSSTLVGEMATFRASLGEHEKAIRSRIEAVNASLRNISFSESTYVQIVATPTRADDISTFRAKLLDCLSGGLLPSDADRIRIFTRIRELIAQFEKDDTWSRRVTDARNWLEFGVREITHSDCREVNYYSASSGKSGGQKAKLAFSILASAITAQYGLVTAESDAKTFRLVVIDEAFARTDEANSQRALELFKRLELQLVIVSPFDAKSRIVEDYVDSLHLTVNPDGNNSRLCRASRADLEAVRSATPHEIGTTA